MGLLYTAQVHTEGGRNGAARSSDGKLDVKLSLPKALGGAEDATNPEQLFAAGYGACFENAVLHIARTQKLAVRHTAVDATVTLHSTEAGPFVLGVELAVAIEGLPQAEAEALVAKAHEVCPYSNAVRGNVDVKIRVEAR